MLISYSNQLPISHSKFILTCTFLNQHDHADNLSDVSEEQLAGVFSEVGPVSNVE